MMNMQTPPSVMGVTETWLNDATSELVNIIGHNFMSNHRISKSGGGVGIYGPPLWTRSMDPFTEPFH